MKHKRNKQSDSLVVSDMRLLHPLLAVWLSDFVIVPMLSLMHLALLWRSRTAEIDQPLG